MMKRKSEGEQSGGKEARPAKRQRQGGRTHLLHLSDELLLRSLSFLPIESLVKCERVCIKLQILSRDDEIWREKYYNQFIRRRARRLPALQFMSQEERENTALRYSSRRARWLEHSNLLQACAETDWKHVYKVKHNWSRGKARKSEVQIDSKPSPFALAKTCQGRLYTADIDHGLRVWKKGSVEVSCPLSRQSPPSALAVEAKESVTRVCIGHENGAVLLFMIEGNNAAMNMDVMRAGASSINSVALVWPYVMVLSSSTTITLLQQVYDAKGSTMRVLATLHTGTALSSAALSLRKSSDALIAGITYAFHRFNTGWCLGLQEIRMNLEGTMTCNRTTSSISSSGRETLTVPKAPSFTSRSAATAPFSLHPQLMRAPNSLSYCGCYILAGLPDNTLMVYTVTSTQDRLEIGVGRRLWGHTSAVSAAEVSSTGKAVSISSKSDEMRYWELEEVLTCSSLRKTSTPIETSAWDSLNGAITRRGNGIGLATRDLKHEDQLLRRCVSFDEEQAIVVGERGQTQIISCFDFA